MRKFLLRHNLLIVLCALLVLPGFFYLLGKLTSPHVVPKPLRFDFHLVGVTIDLQKPKFDIAHFISHDIQKYTETKMASILPMRSLFIRMNNQFYYSLFNKSYAENGLLVVGKAKQLMTENYIKVYCGIVKRYTDHSKFIEYADKLKALSDYFEKRDITFIYLITPSKAEYMPEAIPDRFHCNVKGVGENITQMTKLLDERKVRYVDGSHLMVDAAKQYGISMFPRGGIHWNMLGASIAANAIIHAINRDGHVAIKPLSFVYQLTKKPLGHDRDLLDLLNLIHPNAHYQVPKVTYHEADSPSKPISATFIGGSFCEQLLEIFKENNQFSKMAFYRYFKLDETDFVKGKKSVTHEVDITSLASFKTLLSSKIVILEENSESTISNHGELFYEVMKKFGLV